MLIMMIAKAEVQWLKRNDIVLSLIVHTSMESRQNDIAIHNYTFIESDSTLLMDRSRYTLSSESINKDAANSATPT